jgi:transcriptional regulator EpsA
MHEASPASSHAFDNEIIPVNIRDTSTMQNSRATRNLTTPTAEEVNMPDAIAIHEPPSAVADDESVRRDDVTILGVPDLENLQIILDRSLRVHARSHFFVWSQGIVQALLPHEIMVCVLAGAQPQEHLIDVLASVPLAAGHVEFLRRTHGGFIDKVVRNWTQSGRRPVVYQRDSTAGNVDAQLAADMAAAPFNNFSAHGMCGVSGALNSLFVLLNQSGAIGSHQTYLLETLLPYFHATWLRVHLGQRRTVVPLGASSATSLLSERELEVIRWVHEGKSNIQIGAQLKISPLTVKNHVQKILRKLNVHNRPQLVAKSLALRIIDVSHHA